MVLNLNQNALKILIVLVILLVVFAVMEYVKKIVIQLSLCLVAYKMDFALMWSSYQNALIRVEPYRVHREHYVLKLIVTQVMEIFILVVWLIIIVRCLIKLLVLSLMVFSIQKQLNVAKLIVQQQNRPSVLTIMTVQLEHVVIMVHVEDAAKDLAGQEMIQLENVVMRLDSQAMIKEEDHAVKIIWECLVEILLVDYILLCQPLDQLIHPLIPKQENLHNLVIIGKT